MIKIAKKLAYLKNTRYRKISIALVIYMIVLYILESTGVLTLAGSDMANYIVLPVVWGMPAVLIYYFLPRVHTAGKLKYKSEVYIWAFNFGVGYMVCNIVGGVLQGFGKSPYSHSLSGMLSNLYMIGTVLIGKECIRAYIVQSYEKEKKLLLPFCILMTLINVRFSTFTSSMENIKDATQFIAQNLIPEFGTNILTAYLVLYGGPLASIIYRGVLEGFNWFSPILPDINWLAKGVIGILVPSFATLYLTNAYKIKLKKVKVCREKKENLVVNYIVIALSVSMIWFVVGVFPMYPSVIATGSMKPVIDPGDIVVVKKIVDEKQFDLLREGDIIQYERDGLLIVHRVKEIVKENNTVSYRTKGDNNTVEDGQLVGLNQVRGTVQYIIPKLGWPSLILKRTDPDIKEQVEF